jgi:4'-phosphopantetheinyl transferase
MSMELSRAGASAFAEAGGSENKASARAISWPFPPETIHLEETQAHIWCAVVPDFEGQLPTYGAILSFAERARAERFRFPKDRNHYIIRHGILRLLLSRYLGKRPAEIEFQYGPRGKPQITGDPAQFHFNDSHSGDLALYAFTSVCPIGADIECVRPIPEFEDIATRYFSPREVGMMRALSPEKRMEAFYACWTRKEAFLKATGEGIGTSLAEVEVTLAPGEDAEVLRVPGELQEGAEWKLRALSPASGYLGAIAFQGAIDSVCSWTVPVSL